MTQLQKLGLIAGLALASATSLPQSSHAQSGLPVIASGSWSGTEYWISFTYTENGLSSRLPALVQRISHTM
jgi:hypothetical protein